MADDRDHLWAWFAGLYESSGSVTTSGRSMRFQMKSTSQDVLRKALAVAGGTLRGPYDYEYKDGIKRQPYWLWSSDGQSTKFILENMEPHLSASRLGRINELLDQGFQHTLRDLVQFKPRDRTTQPYDGPPVGVEYPSPERPWVD